MKTYVLYHKFCKDGFGAAWAALTKLGFPSKDLKYIAVSHDEPPPEIEEGSTVYILDFSYPRDVLLKMKEKTSFMKVLDHHKTAEEDLKGLDFCDFDMNRSGAMMAWNHFNPDREPPDLIKYIQDRDLWKWELPNSREHSIGLASYNQSFETWSMLAHQTAKLIKEGETLLKFQNKQVGISTMSAHLATIGGHKVPVVNCNLFISEVGSKLCSDHPSYPFVGIYHTTSDLQKKWSLRTAGSFDVSAIAKQYGGGGHAQAAGFIETEGIGPKIVFEKFKSK